MKINKSLSWNLRMAGRLICAALYTLALGCCPSWTLTQDE